MHALYLASVWLHILAAVTWIGGSIFIVLVLVPLARSAPFRRGGIELLHRAARRFSRIGWACFAVLLGTGLFNLAARGMLRPALTSSSFWETSQGRMLAWKLALVGGILALSAVHDFVLGPVAAAAHASDPSSPAARRFRHACRWGGRVTLLLGLAVTILGVALVRSGS